jgi:RHS repeat-associated protein
VQAQLDPAQHQQPTTSTGLGRHPHEVQTTELHERFGYDAIGNLAKVGEEPLRYRGDVVTERGPDRYEWDARGRLTSRTVLRNGFRPQTWLYGWDGLNRLVHVRTPAGQHWRYVYDALGRRRAKVCQTPLPQAEAHQRPRLRSAEYLWEGAAVAAQWKVYADGTSAAPGMAAASAPVHEHVQEWHYEADSFNPLAVVQQRGDDTQAKLYHVVSDLNGAPRELIGNDGELVWAGQLDTWGRLRRCDVEDRDRAHAAQFSPSYRAAANDALIDVDLRFANQWADEESGLSYNLNRYYDPDLGSYISQDPLGLAGGIRTHGYVHNPLTWIDPLGLAGCPSNLKYGVNDPPVRIPGKWSDADLKAGLQGKPPASLGRPDLHHADQMPGSAIHEVVPEAHRGNSALHPNKFNQGVTPAMRAQDRQLHWWYRAQEEGAWQQFPDLIYD